ncbi:unnamed protein product, partial [Polarella glacialis]
MAAMEVDSAAQDLPNCGPSQPKQEQQQEKETDCKRRRLRWNSLGTAADEADKAASSVEEVLSKLAQCAFPLPRPPSDAATLLIEFGNAASLLSGALKQLDISPENSTALQLRTTLLHVLVALTAAAPTDGHRGSPSEDAELKNEMKKESGETLAE